MGGKAAKGAPGFPLFRKTPAETRGSLWKSMRAPSNPAMGPGRKTRVSLKPAGKIIRPCRLGKRRTPGGERLAARHNSLVSDRNSRDPGREAGHTPARPHR